MAEKSNIFTRLFKPLKRKLEERRTYSELVERSEADRDYYLLLVLSAVIATFGLYLDSVAVIIGAMLIAPLMSPILGVGLAIASGDLQLIKDAMITIFLGTLVAIVASVAIGFILPRTPLGDEVISRTKPNIFDLLVAFFSGIAGAYAFSSEELNEYIPGVAIAAALIPPLGVMGIGVSFDRILTTLGGLLLFISNLVAVSFGAAVTFILLKFPQKEEEGKTVRKKSLLASVVLIILVLIPMAYFTVTSVMTSNRLNYISGLIEDSLPPEGNYSILEIEDIEHGLEHEISVFISGDEEPPESSVSLIENKIDEKFGDNIEIQLNYIPSKKLFSE